ncbi:hypothetical protein ANN_02662 [Periplaneta americana]|uniref:Uncharacterized protein n=1 Tax=Periplaneta americana TaxID=6978 RepID=A0ABQ8TZU0_PERAM|nr:hypothetical protein ANN_02662 [Periplaneta americana]
MSPGSSTESYPAFARIVLRENSGKKLNQILFKCSNSRTGRQWQYKKNRHDCHPTKSNNGYIIDPTVRFEKQKSQPEDVNREKAACICYRHISSRQHESAQEDLSLTSSVLATNTIYDFQGYSITPETEEPLFAFVFRIRCKQKFDLALDSDIGLFLSFSSNQSLFFAFMSGSENFIRTYELYITQKVHILFIFQNSSADLSIDLCQRSGTIALQAALRSCWLSRPASVDCIHTMMDSFCIGIQGRPSRGRTSASDR